MRLDASASPSVLITVRGSATRNPGTSKTSGCVKFTEQVQHFCKVLQWDERMQLYQNISSTSTSSFGKSNYGFLIARPVDSQTVRNLRSKPINAFNPLKLWLK